MFPLPERDPFPVKPRIVFHEINEKPKAFINNSRGVCISAIRDITFSVAAYGTIVINHDNGWVSYTKEQVQSFEYQDNVLTIVLKQ